MFPYQYNSNTIFSCFPLHLSRIKWHHGVCIDIECVESTSDEDIFEDDTSTTPVSSSPCVEHSIERRPSHSHNPWILHCHRGHIAKMLGLDVEAGSSQQSHSQCHFEKLPSFEFLLLENLTWRSVKSVRVHNRMNA